MKRMILTGCLLAAVVGGCTTYPMAENITYGDAWRTSLAGAPRVTPANETTPMRVEVPLENETLLWALDLNYRFLWFDRNGEPAKGSLHPANNSGWSTIRIEAGDAAVVSGVAPNTDAVNWELELKLNDG